MNRLTIVLIIVLFYALQISAQHKHDYGKTVELDTERLSKKINNTHKSETALLRLPLPDGGRADFIFKNTPLYKSQPASIKSLSGASLDQKIPIKLTLTSSGLIGMMKYQNGYWFIEPHNYQKDKYHLYNINELPQASCGSDHLNKALDHIKKTGYKSSAPFPTGNLMRHFRMAAAATGEMTQRLGSQSAARDQIIAIINAANLIYESELAITFDLIDQSVNGMEIIFTDGANDPFTVNETFASAGNAQSGFIAMHSSQILTFDQYDIGHVFHVTEGACCSASGQAGPAVCINNNKASAWSQFSQNSPVGFITTLFVHEVGHQFQAWHSYNASGGNPGNTSFCDYGWDNDTAIEPGSGSTIMAYGNNCSSPVDYVLDSPNNESYFHTKSLEQINVALSSTSACYTTTETGNSPPVSDAGQDFVLPKATPFELVGMASDQDGDILSYVWEQYDIASKSDKGALGSLISGDGGYTAVNSTDQAPLFRSVMSNSTNRVFPRLQYILDGTNDPHDNLGEDLPQVGRNMTFRFTVRDNATSGGGVDSDETELTVDGDKGPFLITNLTGDTTLSGGMSINVEWSVNGTDLISPNIQIALSIDGGYTFPVVLKESTPNDGSESVTIPTDITVSSNARIKISSLHHPTASFFDINDSNLSTQPQGIVCETYMSTDLPITILDNQSVSSKLSITTEGVITDLDVVNLKGTHSWIGDVLFSLIGPDNTEIDIVDRRCNSYDDFDLSLDDDAGSSVPCPYNGGGTYQPDDTLSIFNGKDQFGTWTLVASDNFGSDQGEIESWGLKICRQEEVFSISDQLITDVQCDRDSLTFTYNFTVLNGSGSYSIIDEANRIIAQGDQSPIPIDLSNTYVSGYRELRVLDNANSELIGGILGVELPSCPCSDSDISYDVTQEQIVEKAFISGDTIDMSEILIDEPDVLIVTKSELILGEGFEVELPNTFSVSISACPE